MRDGGGAHSILVRLVTSLTMRVVRLVPVGWGSGQAGAGQAGARRAVDKKHCVFEKYGGLEIKTIVNKDLS